MILAKGTRKQIWEYKKKNYTVGRFFPFLLTPNRVTELIAAKEYKAY